MWNDRYPYLIKVCSQRVILPLKLKHFSAEAAIQSKWFVNQSSGYISDNITWMCSTSAKCNRNILLYFSWRCEKKNAYSVVISLCGCCNFASWCSSSVSHLHQLKRIDCYHTKRCMIFLSLSFSLLFLRSTESSIFYFFSKLHSKMWFLIMSPQRWSAFGTSAITKHARYQLTWWPKQKCVKSAALRWSLLEVWNKPTTHHTKWHSSPLLLFLLVVTGPLCLKCPLSTFLAVCSE